MKLILILLGTLSLIIGIVGIFVPVLPTTPFLLLTAALYVKSSDRLYQFIIGNRYFGSYIVKYQTKKGMSQREKVYSISLMWIMIVITCFLILDSTLIRIFITLVGLIGTLVMGYIIPTVKY